MPAVICPAKGGQRHGRRYVRLSVAVLLKSVEVRVRRGANLFVRRQYQRGGLESLLGDA